MEPAKAEQQLVAHLKFFTNVVTLSINSLGREFVGPIVSKLFLNDLLGTLSLVAERFGMPSGTAATFLSYVSSDNKARVVSIPNYYSPLVEKELALLLDVTLVRLNERQEESVMNELFRGPIVNKPERYNGLLTFMLRQLMTAGIPNSQRKIFTDSNAVKNPYLLYHILGLHDDEGSAAAERVVDAENTNIRTRFQHLVISKYIIHACRGTLSRVPPPPSSATKNISASPSPVIPPAVSSSTNVLTQIPQGITPAFIHILEYLVILSTAANREILLKALFSNKSHVLQYIENCCSVAIKNSRAIGMDVLAANVRFIKAVISCMGFRNLDVDENPLNIFSMPINDPLPKSLVTTICRQLTVERNIFGPLLVAYNSVGGVRKNSVYHSSIFALLDLVETHLPSQKEVDDAGPFNTTLRDVRDFIYLRHSNDMPPVFVKRYSDCMMHELAVRLGREDASCSRSQSVSALSSNSQSESFRSSSKLRFVDEVEAAIGGVDGNCVSPKVSGLSPSAIAAVAHDELQRKRSSKLIEAVVDQFSPSGSFHKRHASDGVTSPTDQLSPPSAANIPRPASGSFSLEDARSPKSMSSSFKSSSLKLDNKDERMEPLKPTAPKTEKPANSFRPRSISSSESSDSTKNGEKPAKENGAVSPSAKSKTANSSPDNAILASSTSSASSDTNVVLPKIKKKSAPSPMKDSHHSSSKGKK
ncbi:hypothetical protein AGDE_12785 [Angomonas deanei]|uniref:Uncharacterized protein n=1 Tax=Angomonas deanei TaxID=59799 RepID=A0A7G2CBA5_9TRYP|nr:hypothetical protein AGDE_12785 [Angomonas deanei]CAD2216799.1 hypothetical protein, conserved [Angomonas deanei]|eukprot:EPY23509.1 hypothetical protein AGDE_12785 [Angomonas deanei]